MAIITIVMKPAQPNQENNVPAHTRIETEREAQDRPLLFGNTGRGLLQFRESVAGLQMRVSGRFAGSFKFHATWSRRLKVARQAPRLPRDFT